MKSKLPPCGSAIIASVLMATTLFMLTAVPAIAENKGPVGPKLTPKLKDLIVPGLRFVTEIEAVADDFGAGTRVLGINQSHL